MPTRDVNVAQPGFERNLVEAAYREQAYKVGEYKQAQHMAWMVEAGEHT